jgi:hypothetical protein
MAYNDGIGIGSGNYNPTGWTPGGYQSSSSDFGSGEGSFGAGIPGMGGSNGSGFNWQQMAPGLGAGIGDLFAGFMMGGNNTPNPANSAMPYLNQIPGAMSPYFNPYIKAGQGALGNLQNQYGQLTGQLPSLQNQYSQMTNNPSGVMNNIGSGFHQSPGFQFQTNQALGAANRAAAAGGMLGSPQEQQNIAGTVNGMANQDYYNYLNHAMGMYGQGLQGQQNLYGMGLQGEQGINNMGYGASNEFGQDLMSQLMSQANLSYAGQADQNQAQQGQQGAESGLFGSAIGALAPYAIAAM